ncbi:TRAP-type C4-dicarboxylate transport system permease small subunit [Natranaerovirga hydrolytica]|uniref:TRAP-type C4-dicarboxylate transport system permease small subunit n=1 Tax=Natranaerovirga hydrolytica TaxID=680378 RepID=A0A4R1MZ40_9FIRM|nr:TRAP transporter small permease [Natranaerovirga hydrolytica]TCK98587.1 TRAP-type C4-dicarboxylate transport system permease small subunit [Natranaerovirga hydrolytica]
MKALRNFLNKTLEVMGMTILSIMVVTVCYQIFTRTVLNNPNTITEEFVRFSLVWLAMISTAYVVGDQKHLSVSLLSDKLTGRNKFILEVVIQGLFLLFAGVVMIFGGIKGVSLTMSQISPSLSIPMGYVYLAVPVSGVIMLIYSILNLIECINNRKVQEG